MGNVFKFLGLKPDHRPKNKVVQFVKHYDEVPESKKSFPLYGQIKKDGVYSHSVHRMLGDVGIFSRTGKRFTNCEVLEKKLEKDLWKTGVYIAELCCDYCSLEELSGIVNPNRKKPLTENQEYLKSNMYLAFHDYLEVDEFVAGHSPTGYSMRHQMLDSKVPTGYGTSSYYVLDNFILENEKELNRFVENAIEAEEEGVVLKNPAEGWVAGHKGYKMMKRVRGVSYDLLCIRAEEGKGKMKGKIGNLFFAWKDGKEIKCPLGKGWTHEDAESMYIDWKFYNLEGQDPVGKTFAVYALQESSKGKLRLAKAGELRHDKTEPDIGGE